MCILQLIVIFYYMKDILKAELFRVFFPTLNSVQVWACEVSGLDSSLKLHGTMLKHHVGWEVKATRC